MKGNPEAQRRLGFMYYHGEGVAQDDKRATDWYRKAAESGDPGSQFMTSLMYYKGRDVASDRIETAKWWTLAMIKDGEFAERIRPSVSA